MKPILLTTVAAFIACFAWQQYRFHTLRSEETLLAENVITAETHGREAPQTAEPEKTKHGVSEAEFAQFIESLDGIRKYRMFANHSDDLKAEKMMIPIIPTIERLSPEQLHAAIVAWIGESDAPALRNILNYAAFGPGVNFVTMATLVNPETVLDTFFQHPEISKDAESYVHKALETLFYNDPDAIVRIAEAETIPDAFRDACNVWRYASAALKEPTAENIKRLFSSPELKRRQDGIPVLALLSRLPTQEGRAAYIQTIHERTKGTFDKGHILVQPLAERLPFAQLAQLADSAPPMTPSGQNFHELDEPQSLDFRQTVACLSRDASIAARWKWLIKGDEAAAESLLTHPRNPKAGSPLNAIIKSWCGDTFEETATWARSLPPGRVRTAAFAAVENFLIHSPRPELAAEWKAP